MFEPLIRYLHAAYAAPADGVSDAELLARCAAGADDAAFELLVRRHAELVWAVCRAVARDHHAAEDAFQAAFLALARRAAAVRGRCAAGWLARVAYHAALKTRGRCAAALSEEPPSAAPDPCAVAERAELGAVVQEELNRLPERYRVPVVLCHLHGLTQAEAAKQLELPVGTVATRVRRGLDRLRDRLTRRGVALPAAGVGGLLGASSAPAVPSGLILTAVRLGTATGVVPANILHLSHGALSAMNPLKWKLPAVVSLAVAVGVVGTAATTGAPDKPAPPPTPAPVIAPIKRPAIVSTYAQREHSRKNLQRIAFAFHAYQNAHNHLPSDILDKNGKPLLSWRVAILPQLEQDYLYAQFKLDEPWDSEHNKKLLPHMPRAYRSPARSGKQISETLYRAFSGPGAALQPGKKLTIIDFPDGTVSTLLAAEAGPAVPWTKPADLAYDPKKPLPAMNGPYSDRIITVFMDGSAHDLRWNMPERLYRLLIERADGNVFLRPDAPPAPPRNEAERKLIEQSRKWAVERTRFIGEWEVERQKLLTELQKTGGIPEPAGLGPDASVEQWQELGKQLQRRERLLWDEVEQLRQQLEQRKKGRK
jgi:RNA polymerase sigma factor (sigma-70 family)